MEEPQKKLEEAQKEEQKALLTRQNTRAQSEQVNLNKQLLNMVISQSSHEIISFFSFNKFPKNAVSKAQYSV